MAIKPFSFVLGALAGAAAQYFFDSQSGNRRRSVATDKAEYAAGQAKGAVVEAAKSASPGDTEATDLNEASLARKVETEIFRDENAPKGKVDVNAEGGVVYLRGELDDEGQIEALTKAAEQVDGVERVESLLHTPGTPAPTK